MLTVNHYNSSNIREYLIDRRIRENKLSSMPIDTYFNQLCIYPVLDSIGELSKFKKYCNNELKSDSFHKFTNLLSYCNEALKLEVISNMIATYITYFKEYEIEGNIGEYSFYTIVKSINGINGGAYELYIDEKLYEDLKYYTIESIIRTDFGIKSPLQILIESIPFIILNSDSYDYQIVFLNMLYNKYDTIIKSNLNIKDHNSINLDEWKEELKYYSQDTTLLNNIELRGRFYYHQSL